MGKTNTDPTCCDDGCRSEEGRSSGGQVALMQVKLEGSLKDEKAEPVAWKGQGKILPSCYAPSLPSQVA